MEVDGALVHPSLCIINLLRELQKPGTAFAETHKRWYYYYYIIRNILVLENNLQQNWSPTGGGWRYKFLGTAHE